jgi:hypothetical protein
MPGAEVPEVFFNGRRLGGYDEIMGWNENGKLGMLFAHMPVRVRGGVYFKSFLRVFILVGLFQLKLCIV